MYFMFLVSLIIKNDLFIQNNFRLDHSLFQFSLQQKVRKMGIFGDFANYKEQFFIFSLNQFHSFILYLET